MNQIQHELAMLALYAIKRMRKVMIFVVVMITIKRIIMITMIHAKVVMITIKRIIMITEIMGEEG